MEYLPLDLDYIPDELNIKLKRELNETEENVQNGLKDLREFLRRERIPSRMDDDFLLQFLRVQKFQLKKSQERLRRYCQMRKNLTELYETVDMEKMKLMIEHRTLGLLPFRDKKRRAVFFSRAYAWRRDLYDENDVALCAMLLFHFSMTFSLTTMSGVAYIGDTRVNSLRDLYPLFNICKNNISTVMTFPIRIQRIDFLNANSLCHCLYHAVRPLLPAKLAKRINLHGSNLKHLHETYHPSILPSEFGGTLGPISNDNFKDKFLEFVQQLKTDCTNYKYV